MSVAAIASWLTPPVAAQDYPTRPLRFVTSAPGGAGDFVSRVIAQSISPALGQAVIVDNRGSGILGMELVAQAKPDGYTLGVLANLVWGDAMLRSQGKWSHTDLEPIGYVNSDPMLWVTATDGPLKGMGLNLDAGAMNAGSHKERGWCHLHR